MIESMRIAQVSPGWSGCALRRMSNNPARVCIFSQKSIFSTALYFERYMQP